MNLPDELKHQVLAENANKSSQTVEDLSWNRHPKDCCLHHHQITVTPACSQSQSSASGRFDSWKQSACTWSLETHQLHIPPTKLVQDVSFKLRSQGGAAPSS